MIELLVKDSRGNIIRHQLGEGKHRLGKSIHSDIVLMDNYASRYHADLIVTKQGVYLIDANSKNGLWVNGRRIKNKVLLQAGDSFQVSNLSLTLAKATHYFALKKGRQYSQDEIDLNPSSTFKSNVVTFASSANARAKNSASTKLHNNKQA